MGGKGDAAVPPSKTSGAAVTCLVLVVRPWGSGYMESIPPQVDAA